MSEVVAIPNFNHSSQIGKHVAARSDLTEGLGRWSTNVGGDAKVFGQGPVRDEVVLGKPEFRKQT